MAPPIHSSADARQFDWIDCPDLIRRADRVFEYPMVDRDAGFGIEETNAKPPTIPLDVRYGP